MLPTEIFFEVVNILHRPASRVDPCLQLTTPPPFPCPYYAPLVNIVLVCSAWKASIYNSTCCWRHIHTDWTQPVQERLLARMGGSVPEIVQYHPTSYPVPTVITSDTFRSCRNFSVSVSANSPGSPMVPPLHFGSPNPALDALVVWNRNSEEYPGDVRFEDDVALFSGRETKPTFVGLYGTFLCLTGLNLERLLALELKRTNFKLSEIVEVIRQACALEDLTISSERALHHDLTSVPASLPSASVVNFKLRLHAPPAHSLLNFFTWPRLQRMNFELFGSHSNCVQAVTRVAASLPGAGSELHVRISPGRVDLGMGPVRLALHTTSPGTAFELAITALPAELVGSIPQILWSHWRCHEVADPPELQALVKVCPDVEITHVKNHPGVESGTVGSSAHQTS